MSRIAKLFNRWSSDEMAAIAARVLDDPMSTELARSLAGSVLSQAAPEQRQTSAEMAALAGRVLNDSQSNSIAKKLAGSVLSQRA
jgi:hypothetical protein